MDICNNVNVVIKFDGDFGVFIEQVVCCFQIEWGISLVNGCIDDVLLECMCSDMLVVDLDFKCWMVIDLIGLLVDGNLGFGEKGELVFEMCWQLEVLGYLIELNLCVECDVCMFDVGMQVVMCNFQQDYGLLLCFGGVIDVDVCWQLNDVVVVCEYVLIIEFDCVENWLLQCLFYMWVEFQLEQVQVWQQVVVNVLVVGLVVLEFVLQFNGVGLILFKDVVLFECICEGVFGIIGDEYVMQVVLEFKCNGIDDVVCVDWVMMVGDCLWVVGLIFGECVSVDMV